MELMQMQLVDSRNKCPPFSIYLLTALDKEEMLPNGELHIGIKVEDITVSFPMAPFMKAMSTFMLRATEIWSEMPDMGPDTMTPEQKKELMELKKKMVR